jgi:hypothetical protein
MATQLKKIVAPSGGDYTALETCMNANEQNLVTADKYFDVEISGTWSSADTTAVTVHNYTTDATRYINIYTTGSARHDGRAAGVSGRSNYRLSGNSASVNLGTTQWITVDGLEILNNATTNAIGIKSIYGGYYGVIYCNNIIHDFSSRGTGLFVGCPYDSGKVYNNIVYNINGEYSTGIGLEYCSGTIVSNNTVYNCGGSDGNESYSALKKFPVLINNIALAAGTNPAFGTYTGDINHDYNISSDTSAAGSNSITNVSASDLFVSITPGSEDLHLKSGAVAIDEGTDLSGTFTTDIDGTTRTGTWDIGADEYVAGTNFSRGDYSPLPTTDADLENIYTAGEVTQVGSDDADRVSQSAIVQYAIHQYKNNVGTATRWSLRWNGQSSMAPSTSKVVLQIYDRDGTTWEDLDEENGVAANTDFDLTATISSNAEHYKDANNIICCRVYQLWSQP